MNKIKRNICVKQRRIHAVNVSEFCICLENGPHAVQKVSVIILFVTKAKYWILDINLLSLKHSHRLYIMIVIIPCISFIKR